MACTRTERCSTPGSARRPRLLANAEGAERCGGGGARPVRRAGPERSSEIVGVIRAFRAPVQSALHAAVGHGWHVGQPDQDRSGVAQPLNHKRVVSGHQVGERWTTRGRREPACEITVLGSKGNPVQRATRLATRPALVGCRGAGTGLRVQHNDGIQSNAGVVIDGDPLQVAFEQTNRGCPSRVECVPHIGDGRFDDVER